MPKASLWRLLETLTDEYNRCWHKIVTTEEHRVLRGANKLHKGTPEPSGSYYYIIIVSLKVLWDFQTMSITLCNSVVKKYENAQDGK